MLSCLLQAEQVGLELPYLQPDFVFLLKGYKLLLLSSDLLFQSCGDLQCDVQIDHEDRNFELTGAL